jgi:hypothetical protein
MISPLLRMSMRGVIWDQVWRKEAREGGRERGRGQDVFPALDYGTILPNIFLHSHLPSLPHSLLSY